MTPLQAIVGRLRWWFRSRRQKAVAPPAVKRANVRSVSKPRLGSQPPVLGAQDRQELDLLVSRAWRFRSLPSTPFLLELYTRDPETMLQAIYAHARKWAPGLDVPYATPRLRFIPQGSGPAGSFSATADGWTTIEVCSSLRSRPEALARVLAHEACHHILGHAGLSLRTDTIGDERRTELAMFVLGFGQVAIDGEMSMTATGLRCDPALGYMDHCTMLVAEGIVQRRVAGLSATGMAEASMRELEAQARRLFNAPGQLERMLADYERLHPSASRTETLHRMIEEYQRDRR